MNKVLIYPAAGRWEAGLDSTEPASKVVQPPPDVRNRSVSAVFRGSVVGPGAPTVTAADRVGRAEEP